MAVPITLTVILSSSSFSSPAIQLPMPTVKPQLLSPLSLAEVADALHKTWQRQSLYTLWPRIYNYALTARGEDCSSVPIPCYPRGRTILLYFHRSEVAY